jgi:D-arabinose 1-dehydrogenase-like Zn-dependent alcohol dehydrogenase
VRKLVNERRKLFGWRVARSKRDNPAGRSSLNLQLHVVPHLDTVLCRERSKCFDVPMRRSADVGGLTSCAIITAVHAYRRARLSVSDTAVVLGTGGIGQILIQILKHAGLRVIEMSRSERSLELAKQVGADLCVALGDDKAEERVLEFSGGLGAAVTFECVGFAATMKMAADCAARGGQIIVIGEEADFPAIDTIQIAQRELEIIGSRNGSKQDAADALQWVAQGIIDPPIVERFPLERINEGLAMVRDGSAHGRIVITIENGVRRRRCLNSNRLVTSNKA